jgi:7tm Chemosensory receptor.
MKRTAAMHIGMANVNKILYYVSKIFGLAPFKLTENHVRKRVLLNTKLSDNLLNNFWCLFILSLMILGAIMQFSVFSKLVFTKVLLVTELSTALSFLSSLVSLFTVNMKRHIMARLVKKLSEIDEVLFKQEDQGMELKRIKYITATKICILIISDIICMIVGVVAWGEVTGHFQIFLVWLSNLVSTIVSVHLLGFMSYVQHKLALLNLVITSVFKEESLGILPYNSSKRTFGASFQCAYCLRMHPRAKKLYTSLHTNTITVLNCNHSEIRHCGVPVLQNSFPLDITYVRELYNSVYEFLGSVSSIYGFPILVQLAHNFMILVGLSYVFIGIFYDDEILNVNLHSNHHKFALRMCVTGWLVITLLKQVFITVACNNVTNESKRISDNVQKLLLHQSLTADILHQLQLFSFQLLSCKMEFSAAGLFSVNLSYLYSSIAAVITYIVVLVQFK